MSSRTGQAKLPLHGGSCPPWLFERMKKLGTAIVEAMLVDHSRREVIRRFSDPTWFQSLGCLLGFDWHSSGLTTVLCGALKEGLNPRVEDLGIFIAGGKGSQSRRTPNEIEQYADSHSPTLDVEKLQKVSRKVAQVDSSALQDGFQVYHHNLFLTEEGHWSVVQQGMSEGTGWARRYHWMDEQIDESFVENPHTGLSSRVETSTLDLTNSQSEQNRQVTVEISTEDPVGTLKEFKKIRKMERDEKLLQLPRRHDIPRSETLDRILGTLYERQPTNFEDLLDTDNVGPKTVRALSMVAEVVWGADPSYEDPVRYSYAHGGKDGFPYPVNVDRYDDSIQTLSSALHRANIDSHEKKKAFDRFDKLRRLAEQETSRPEDSPRLDLTESRAERSVEEDSSADDQISLDFD